MYTPFHLHNEGLTIGLLLALVSVSMPRLLGGSPSMRTRVLAVAGATSVVALMLRAANGTVFPFLSLALIYGSIMIALLAMAADRLRLLESRGFYRVSRLSYGMYLNHFAVLRWIAPSVARSVKAVGGQNPVTLFVTLSVVIAISLSFAMATFVLIEHPFLALRERVQSTKSKLHGLAPSYATVVAPVGRYPFGQLGWGCERTRIRVKRLCSSGSRQCTLRASTNNQPLGDVHVHHRTRISHRLITHSQRGLSHLAPL